VLSAENPFYRQVLLLRAQGRNGDQSLCVQRMSRDYQVRKGLY
jgi:hypothetical protein